MEGGSPSDITVNEHSTVGLISFVSFAVRSLYLRGKNYLRGIWCLQKSLEFNVLFTAECEASRISR